MAIKTKGKNARYVKFTEHNDNEGESWNFFIPLKGNEEAIEHVSRLIKDHDSYEMDVDRTYTREDARKICSECDGTTYMPEYSMTKGWEGLPDTVDWFCEDPFYKGRLIKYE